MTVCRKISFSSGHRYFNPRWSEEKNRSVYGNAYSEHGHGHNYVLEAYLDGPIDPDTGMVINLKEVDTILKEVVEPLDHHFLNTDVDHFQHNVPTTENVAAYCFEEVRKRFRDRVRLRRVRLYEGQDLWVDCEEI